MLRHIHIIFSLLLVASGSFAQPDVQRPDTLQRLRWEVLSLCGGEMDALRSKAEAGDPRSQTEYALIVGGGIADPKNRDEQAATAWLSKAAEQGYPPAEAMLADIYLGGGVAGKDFAAALQLIRKAAEGGVAEAQSRLARFYADGTGLATDRQQAYSWAVIARASGARDASNVLSEVSKNMNEDEIASAKRAAEAWMSSHPLPPLRVPVVSGRDFAIPPTATYDRMPEYTPEAKAAHLEGYSELWAVIDANGRVADVLVTRPLGMGLDCKAMETFRRWKFKPAATKDGRPVAVEMIFKLQFRRR